MKLQKKKHLNKFVFQRILNIKCHKYFVVNILILKPNIQNY